MSDNWQRQRRPDEVPTPVAVAVSDFCRRAGSPASAAVVREALALVGEAEDFRVRQLTDEEPGARPLGPFAVVDLLWGTSPGVAARRQEVGFYDLVRTVAELRHSPPPTPTAAQAKEGSPEGALPQERRAPTPDGGDAPRRGARAPAHAKPSVQERIAPKRRTAHQGEEDAEPEVPSRRRELPAPRGRFARLPSPKQPYADLRAAPAHDSLLSLLEQHPDRFALLRSLAEQFSGSRGDALTEEDMQEALGFHGLLPRLEAKERQAVVSSYTEHRGAAGRVAWALGLSPSELSRLVQVLGLQRDVEDVRERFRRDALSPQNLGYRLDLLGRGRYLADLGIKRRFTESLTGDLRALVRDAAVADTLDAGVRAISRSHGVSHELLGRALEKLGLKGELERRLAGAPRHPPSS